MGLELQEWVCKGTHEHLGALPRNEQNYPVAL